MLHHPEHEITILQPQKMEACRSQYKAIHFGLTPSMVSCDHGDIVLDVETMTIRIPPNCQISGSPVPKISKINIPMTSVHDPKPLFIPAVEVVDEYK